MPPTASLTNADLFVDADPRAPINASDAGPLIKRIRQGLEVLLDRGGIDARASRQKGEVHYKGVSSLSFFRLL
jgi:hypothetical protein